MLENDIKKILVSHDEITEAAKKLGAQLTKDYEGKNPSGRCVVGVSSYVSPLMEKLIDD